MAGRGGRPLRLRSCWIMFIVVGPSAYWALLALCLLIGETRRPEVRPPLPRRLFPLRLPPLRRSSRGRRTAAPRGSRSPSNVRGRVYCGCSSSPSSKLSSPRLCRLPQHARDQPHARLDRHHRRRLAAGEDRVADGDLLEPAGVEHPLVHPLEPAAEDDQSRRRRPAPCTRAWVRGRPRALMYKSGRPRPLDAVQRRGRSTSARMTCPGPPPAGVSSRKPRLSSEKPRMSTVSRRHSPCSRQAVPISDDAQRARKGLGEHGQDGGGEHGRAYAPRAGLRLERPLTGDRVGRRRVGIGQCEGGRERAKRRRTSGAGPPAQASGSAVSSPSAVVSCGRAMTTRRSAMRTSGTASRVNGSVPGRPPVAGVDLQEVAGAEVVHRLDAAQRPRRPGVSAARPIRSAR